MDDHDRAVLDRYLRGNVVVGLCNRSIADITFQTAIAREALSLDPPRIHIAAEKMGALSRTLSDTHDYLVREIERLS